MNVLNTIGAATSPVLSSVRTGEAAVVRCAAPAVHTVEGTGLPIAGPSVRKLDRTRLPFAGLGAPIGAYGVVMGADQVETTVVRIPAADDQGIPPRRTLSRC